MLAISLTNKEELSEIDKLLEEQIQFLKEQYALGNFIALGRKIPRTRAVILFHVKTLSELENIMGKKTFYINHLADYDSIGCVPSMTSEAFKALL